MSCLQEGLHIAEQLGAGEEEARIRHRLGLALWQQDQLEPARHQLDTAAHLLERLRRLGRGSAESRLALYDLQTAAFHSLQRLLVLLGRDSEALVVAERSRTRAFLDLVRERNSGAVQTRAGHKVEESAPRSVTEIEKIVNRQKASVLYYSLAADYLYCWLIVPTRGIVKFHQTCLLEEGQQEQEETASLLDSAISSLRESLGVDAASIAPDSEEEESSGAWSHHLEELGDRLNADGDRTGFLRMVNRSSRLNASSYSLSSLFSVGSLGGSTVSGAASRAGSTRSRGRPGWQGPRAMQELYSLLVEPMEDELPEGLPSELMLVLEGDLYLIPFPVLRPARSSDFLCERFSLVVAPSLTASRPRHNRPSQQNQETRRLVVGNPKIPSTVTEHWGWGDIPHSEQEAAIVSEILQTRALVGQEATKETLLSELEGAESVHLSVHVSWKLSALVVSPAEFMDSRSRPGSQAGNPRRYSIHSDTIHEEEDVRSEATTIELPALSEFLLTAADLLSLRLSAKLVVISSCHTRDRHGCATSDGVIALSRALLAAGAQCVMVSLWPVPDTAVKLIMKAFYSSLLQGSRVSRALAEAMTAVQTTKYFQHPANWAGFVLIGQDVKLSNKVAMMGQALREIISAPDRCRDALRVTLHLVSSKAPSAWPPLACLLPAIAC